MNSLKRVAVSLSGMKQASLARMETNEIQYDTFRGQDTGTTPANRLGEKNSLE